MRGSPRIHYDDEADHGPLNVSQCKVGDHLHLIAWSVVLGTVAFAPIFEAKM
jgi:hypothetical protein